MMTFCVNLNIDRMACLFVYCKKTKRGTQIVKLKIFDYTTIIQFWFVFFFWCVFYTVKETGIDKNENKTKRLKLHKKNSLTETKTKKMQIQMKIRVNKLKEALHPLNEVSKWIVPFVFGFPNRKCEKFE